MAGGGEARTSAVASHRSVFLSYRRDDSAGWAGRLADRLTARLGAGEVFLDVDSIPVGRDFAESIDARLETVSAMLVLIGPEWLDARTPDGRVRLRDPEDFVRREIATALSSDLLVIPVLLDGAAMPTAADLPDELVALAQRNAIRVHAESFDAAVARVFDALGVSDTPTRRLDHHTARLGAVVAATALVVVAGVLLIARWRDGGDGSSTSPSTTVVTTVAATVAPTTAAATTTTPTTTPASSTAAFEVSLEARSSSGRELETIPDGVVVIVQVAGADLPDPADVENDPSVLAFDRSSRSRMWFPKVEAAGQDLQVVALLEGWPEAIVYDRPVAGEVQRVTLELRARSATVTGVVVDQNGSPFAGADVVVVTPTREHPAVTSAQGEYTVAGVEAPATVEVRAAADDYGGDATTLPTSSAGLSEAELMLVYGLGDVAGIVVDDDGQPVGGATVSVSGSPELSVTTLTSGAQLGTYFLPGIEPGVRNLVVDAPGFDTQSVGISVGAGFTAVFDIVLLRSS